MKKTSAEQPEKTDPKLRELEKALKEAQMRIIALNTLIDVAEDQFKIDIRKQTGGGRR